MNTTRSVFQLTLLGVLCALFSTNTANAGQADRFAEVEVTAQQVSGSVYMLTGAGGNIGVTVGPDGTLIIDDQFAPLADKIQAALNGLGGGKPRLVLNTHFHGDHTGSNAHFGTDGTIIAHDNVRIRLLGTPDIDRAALPLVTFEESLTVHFNDEEMRLIHLPEGHTDGDSVVWFTGANVIHLGDHLFVDRFPFVDIQSGGTVAGFADNLARVLDMVPDDIQVIPGHGPLTDKAAIEKSVHMIRTTRKVVTDALNSGMNTEQIVAQGLGPQWANFGGGFISEERWIQILVADLALSR
jgi:glyoxylase-like metal-dependent hydrolase (beta-lactamase superfamily II)